MAPMKMVWVPASIICTTTQSNAAAASCRIGAPEPRLDPLGMGEAVVQRGGERVGHLNRWSCAK